MLRAAGGDGYRPQGLCAGSGGERGVRVTVVPGALPRVCAHQRPTDRKFLRTSKGISPPQTPAPFSSPRLAGAGLAARG